MPVLYLPFIMIIYIYFAHFFARMSIDKVLFEQLYWVHTKKLCFSTIQKKSEKSMCYTEYADYNVYSRKR